MLREIDDERIREQYVKQASGLYWLCRMLGNDSASVTINTFLPPNMRIKIEAPKKSEEQEKKETRESLMLMASALTGKHNAEFWRD